MRINVMDKGGETHVEEPLGGRGGEEGQHAGAAARLADDRDAGGVTAKGADVLLLFRGGP